MRIVGNIFYGEIKEVLKVKASSTVHIHVYIIRCKYIVYIVASLLYFTGFATWDKEMYNVIHRRLRDAVRRKRP